MEGENEKAKVWKYVPAFVIVLSAFLFMQTVSGIKEYRYIGSSGIGQNTITVSGEGEVFAVPDVASLTFRMFEVSKDTDEAQRAVTEKTNIALERLKSLGIDEKDIKTIDYSIYPQYDYNQVACLSFPCPPGRSELVGYEVSQTISVKLRDVERSGEVLGALGQVGADNISGLSFTIDDEDELVREARRLAIEDARAQARNLSKDLKVRLVRIVNFSEGGNYPMYYKADMALGMGGGEESRPASAPSLPVGENRIVSNVSITYEIR